MEAEAGQFVYVSALAVEQLALGVDKGFERL
jgi:hypothetical protein